MHLTVSHGRILLDFVPTEICFYPWNQRFKSISESVMPVTSPIEFTLSAVVPMIEFFVSFFQYFFPNLKFLDLKSFQPLCRKWFGHIRTNRILRYYHIYHRTGWISNDSDIKVLGYIMQENFWLNRLTSQLLVLALTTNCFFYWWHYYNLHRFA